MSCPKVGGNTLPAALGVLKSSSKAGCTPPPARPNFRGWGVQGGERPTSSGVRMTSRSSSSCASCRVTYCRRISRSANAFGSAFGCRWGGSGSNCHHYQKRNPSDTPLPHARFALFQRKTKRKEPTLWITPRHKAPLSTEAMVLKSTHRTIRSEGNQIKIQTKIVCQRTKA